MTIKNLEPKSITFKHANTLIKKKPIAGYAMGSKKS
tara:strand:- start:611 stop:718 length:108 start_codon:yes stop_codon:yes gene_type:complete